eukprot:737006-Heterocapsa_arctica.AAC.1
MRSGFIHCCVIVPCGHVVIYGVTTRVRIRCPRPVILGAGVVGSRFRLHTRFIGPGASTRLLSLTNHVHNPGL